jgi:hypothetical protein
VILGLRPGDRVEAEIAGERRVGTLAPIETIR